MFPQDLKYFRFRFSRVMTLVFLLAFPTQASSGPKSCAEVITAWLHTPRLSSEFLIKLIECLNRVPLQINSWKPMLGSIPIKKPDFPSPPSAEHLFFLSAYLLYESFKLYVRAMNLDIDYEMYHREKFEVQRELNNLKDFIEKELIPQSKQGNITDLKKVTKKLLGVLSRYSEVLRELVQAIHRDTKKAASDQRWSAAFAVGATALCAGSLFVGNNEVLAAGTCLASGGALALNVKSYFSHSETLKHSLLLLKDTKEMSEEIAKYRRYLLIEMSGEF